MRWKVLSSPIGGHNLVVSYPGSDLVPLLHSVKPVSIFPVECIHSLRYGKVQSQRAAQRGTSSRES